MFGIDPDVLNQANQAHATAYWAIKIALIEKGVITEDEYSRAYAKATHIVEQEFAKKRDEATPKED